MLYNNLSSYLKNKYGRRLSKICIDGGFSCPNRDGRCGVGGCIYCGERGAGEHIKADFHGSEDGILASIEEQVRVGLSAKGDGELFIAYFQNFTNTYAEIRALRRRYDAALIDSRIKILAIGTRPDCIDESVAELIASYKDRVEVWVELGFQTASDETAKIINRGYPTEVFRSAMRILEKYGIKTVVHLMIGLPGEGDAELSKTLDTLSEFSPFGVKLHSVYVMKNTRLAELYERGEYEPITLETYARRAAYAITRLHPDTVIHRLTGDCPRGMLLAPEWNTQKSAVIAKIVENLNTGAAYQGLSYKKR